MQTYEYIRLATDEFRIQVTVYDCSDAVSAEVVQPDAAE
jgi:hypothetical protein